MKVAIVHYWLVSMRGGEKVLEALCQLYPQADVFTHVYDPDAIDETITSHDVRTTFINRLPMAKRLYQKYLPLMPMALEQLDLTDYDLVISSESGPAKGVITRPDTVHICYCHTPMRYVWDQYHAYKDAAGLVTRTVMPWMMGSLRQWDFQSASRVDHFVANSTAVQARIEKFYRRESRVIAPPCATQDFGPSDTQGDYYLVTGQLTAYKRVDLAIEACNALGRNLVVIGEGEERKRLEKLAGPTVRFLGRAPFDVLRQHYAECRALLFPGEEDFGIVPVEAMASGRPVIAFGKGGALDTVIDGETGLHTAHQTAEDFVAAIERFEAAPERFHIDRLRAHAAQFDTSVFTARMRAEIDGRLEAAASHLHAATHSSNTPHTRVYGA